jgi:hypothetical protein
MSVEQTRHIIDHTRAFHRMASKYYHRLAESTQRDRVKLLLDYMSEHELRLAHGLAEYEESAPEKILNTWLQSSGTTDAVTLVTDTETVAEMSVDEIVELGIKLSDCVLDVYHDLSIRAEPESVRQVFANLLNMEEKSLQQFVRDAGRLADL